MLSVLIIFGARERGAAPASGHIAEVLAIAAHRGFEPVRPALVAAHDDAPMRR
jgi:hypothetical protein